MRCTFYEVCCEVRVFEFPSNLAQVLEEVPMCEFCLDFYCVWVIKVCDFFPKQDFGVKIDEVCLMIGLKDFSIGKEIWTYNRWEEG